jgi:hypothetical protein
MRAAILAVFVAGPALTGCTWESGMGAFSVGPETYIVTKPYNSVGASRDAAEKAAVADASQFCTQAGRQYVQVEKDPTAGSANPYGPTYFSVTFKCAAPDASAVAPNPSPPPPNR